MSFASSVLSRVTSLPRRILGTRNERMLKVYRRHVRPINDFEQQARGDFDERFATRRAEIRLEEAPEEERERQLQSLAVELSSDLRERAKVLRERIQPHIEPLNRWWESLTATQRTESYYRGEYRKRSAKMTDALDQEGIVHEAFAVIREAARRAKSHRHFDCQLVGGRVLFEGKIAEMRTGEGKTIVCYMPAFLKVLCGKKVHIITVNDYLVKRDSEFAAAIFELVGVSVGYIQAMVDSGGHEGLRRAAYSCDITYGTNSEFGFDYLRDNMKTRLADQVQGSLDFAIVDEVDSILIDEARTPLIISGEAHDDVSRYPRADRVARELVRRQATWDRKVMSTVAKFDGETEGIPKLEDAMNILGYRERHGSPASGESAVEDPAAKEPNEGNESRSPEGMPPLGPDFLTDDHVEAVQIYENNVLKLPLDQQYRRFFIVQTERKQVGLTHEGVTIAQELLDMGSLYGGANMEWPHLIENSLRAYKVYQRDRDYVVHDGQIVIVDVFTGRLMHGRQWSDGLHQAVEARENVTVKRETQTLATITIQNFVKLYLSRAGMTGTAQTEATEFDKIYGLDVVEIPTNRPVNRIDHNDKMYRDVEQKYAAIVDEIHEVHRRGRPADPFLLAEVLHALRPIVERLGGETGKIDEAIRRFNGAEYGDRKTIGFMLDVYDELMGDLVHGRPVLVGTTSVENSEKLSKLLTQRYGIEHEVLNAKNHAREADIVAKAGHGYVPTQGGDKTARGHVTIATNMAGRGTDIKLGAGVVYEKCRVPATLPQGTKASALFPAGITKCCIHCNEYDPATNCAHCFKPKIDPRFPALGRQVCKLNVPCGLHIIGTERHEARRIDNQLRGRAGRQGDPGSSRFFLSLQDDLLKLFMPDWMLRMMEKLGFTDGTSLEDKRLNKGIERAQRKVEERNFSTRKHLLEWDEPMDFQRKEFYSVRQGILEERDLPGLILKTIDDVITQTVKKHLAKNYARACIAEWCRTTLDLTLDEEGIDASDVDSCAASIRSKARDEAYDQIRTSLGEYIDAEEPPSQWDVGGLVQWAQRTFKVSLTQNQLKKMEPSEIQDVLMEAANRFCDELELGGVSMYLDPQYPRRSLADWARQKFAIRVEMDELADRNAEDIRATLHDRIVEAYRRREIHYPVETALDRAFSGGGTDQAAAAEFVVRWANAKFNKDWTLADVQGKSVQDIHVRLIAMNREYLTTGLAEEIDRNINGKNREEALGWARERFAFAWNEQRYQWSDGDLRQALLEQGREMLRWELSRLEQFVLLRIYDQAWKDHLLEMDHLKSAIMQRPLGGDQTHPQSQYAIEGRDLFNQMWTRIGERVTDIIFKVRATPSEGSGPAMTTGTSGGGPSPMKLQHADSTGAGFARAAADEAAAMRAQNVEQKVQTIRREQPRVGRNDPCPCGSGKKFKQCHGKI